MKHALSGGRFGLACALLGLGVALASGACPGPAARKPEAPKALALGGVRVERLVRDSLPASTSVHGRSGDWTMTSDAVRLVVEGRGHAGALLDLATRAWEEDALDEARPVLSVDGVDRALGAATIEPVELAGRAALRVTQRDESFGLVLVTDYVLAPGEPWVELVSRIDNTGSRARRVSVGDRVLWSGRVPFAPGIGFVEQPQRAKLSWFARAGNRISYAFVFPEPVEVQFVNTLRGPAEQVARTPARSLPPGASLVHRRRIAAVRGELPRAAALAWKALAVPTGIVRGQLAPAPEWARLEARDAKQKIVLAADVAPGGSFELPLPAGAHELELITPGGSDRERVTIEPKQAREARFIVPQAARIAYRVMDPAGTPIPGRVVIRGVPPTVDPVLGPVHLASGAGNVAFTHTGEGTLAVPPGRYELVATAGTEWTIAELTVDVDEKRGVTFRAPLERVVPTPGYIACDFHLHSDPSGDSDVPLADRVTSLVAEGIELAAATDHNHVTDFAPAVGALGMSDRFRPAIGVEITTPNWGHFNTFPYPGDAAPPPYAEVTPAAIFEHVRRVAPGAVVQINHPRMPIDIGYFDSGGLDASSGSTKREGFSFDFDTIEVWNGFELESPDLLAKNLADWYGLLDIGRIYTAVGNSDSHMLVRQWTGYPRTYVRVADGAGPPEVAAALRRGSAFVTNGPFLRLTVEGKQSGELARTRQGKIGIDVDVQAPPWVDVTSVDIVANGTVWQTLAVDPDSKKVERLKRSVEIELERDGWVIAIARGERALTRVLPGSKTKPTAFTNPVFVDVDENGRYDAPRASR